MTQMTDATKASGVPVDVRVVVDKADLQQHNDPVINQALIDLTTR